MSMEKNGAISSDTPSQCCGGNCHSNQLNEKTGSDGTAFPETEKQANEMEQDITKQAIDSVAKSSNPAK